MKYLVVVGGVISGIGKGILASSCGVLLKSMGYKITIIKIDPYLNIDAGLMNPNEHGEVFVLNDGGEVDLDLGNYERSLDIDLCSRNNITTGKIYNKVIDDERKGRYLGKTVQVVPHITNEIQDCITNVAHIPLKTNEVADICIIELGGTIGDIESAPFVEALRQFKKKVGSDNFCLIQVTLVPGTDEQKSKPTQTSVKDLRSLGLIPDIIACRCKLPIKNEIREKVSLFCDVDDSHILSFHDCKTIYDVPILLKSQGLEKIFVKKFNLNDNDQSSSSSGNYLTQWEEMANTFHTMDKSQAVKIAIVGKYTQNADSYFSIIKALEHASSHVKNKIDIVWIDSSDLEDLSLHSDKNYHNDKKEHNNVWTNLYSCDGILVPGGFGSRGTEGKMAAIKYARENNKPFFGICLGMQLAIIEFSRNVLNLSLANSEEFDPDCKDKVIIHMPEIDLNRMGGTQRLGSRETILLDGSKTKIIYDNVDSIHERHRHRYEVNSEYIQRIENEGLKFVGKDINKERMEIIELLGSPSDRSAADLSEAEPKSQRNLGSHPYFIATQFHPEYLSRPLKPAPLFVSFVEAVINYYNRKRT